MKQVAPDGENRKGKQEEAIRSHFKPPGLAFWQNGPLGDIMNDTCGGSVRSEITFVYDGHGMKIAVELSADEAELLRCTAVRLGVPAARCF
jgi:hypothetical protein